MKDPTSVSSNESNVNLLLNNQDRRYGRIRDNANRIIELVLSIISLAASIGFVQFLLSNEYGPISLNLPDNLINQYGAESLTYSGVSLNGLGTLNLYYIFGFAFLALYQVAEMWYINSKIQEMSPLQPRNEVDLYLFDASTWVENNQTVIHKSSRLLKSMYSRVYFSLMFVLMSAFLLIHIHLGNALFVFVSNVIFIPSFCLAIVYYSKKFYSNFREHGDLFQFEYHGLSSISLVLLLIITLVIGYYTISIIDHIWKLIFVY